MRKIIKTLRYVLQITRWFPRGLGWGLLTGVSGAVQKTAGYRGTIDRSDRLPYCHYTQTENNGFREAYSQRLHCEIAFRIGSSNASFAMKYCACSSVAFLSVIISWSVNSNPLKFGSGNPWIQVKILLLDANYCSWSSRQEKFCAF
jgi:hypothetical protein